MSEYWQGVITFPVVVLIAASAFALAGFMLNVWFTKAVPLLRLLPRRLDSNEKRADHAAVMATADRGARLFWIAGFGVYILQHGDLGLGTLHVRNAIATAQREATK